MVVRCGKCSERFDDADRNTICPHDLIMPAADLEQKKAAMALMGKDIVFHHYPQSKLRIQSISFNGMVTIRGMVGEFAPHLFKVAQ